MDQVFLHDNNEDGGLQAAELADFISDGFLTYTTVPGQAKQLPVYQRCVTDVATGYSWVAALDIDEFLAVEDDAAQRRPPQEWLKAVLHHFRFQPGALPAAPAPLNARRSQRCVCSSAPHLPPRAQAQMWSAWMWLAVLPATVLIKALLQRGRAAC